ncbi:MAG: FliH/SctL family protein [Desulfuromonadaceae bacterium]
MSSSKIIKMSDRSGTGVSEFSFRNIGQSGGLSTAETGAGGFVPMTLFQVGDSQDLAVDAEPPVIEISEEDLSQRTSDAFNAGLKEGKDLAERGLVNVFRALRSSSETIHNLRDKILRESEDELINLVMLVARKVILHEVTQDRTILVGVVQNAIAALSAREEIIVHINPDDYLLVTSGHDQLLHSELINERLRLKPDPTVSSGFCLVETEMGTVDASLEGQLGQIYRSLVEQRTAAAVEEL